MTINRHKSVSRLTGTGMKFFALLVTFGVGLASPAYAYLDPGTGSMMLQLLLGGIAGALVVIKLYWQRLKGMFGAKTEPSPRDIQDE